MRLIFVATLQITCKQTSYPHLVSLTCCSSPPFSKANFLMNKHEKKQVKLGCQAAYKIETRGSLRTIKVHNYKGGCNHQAMISLAADHKLTKKGKIHSRSESGSHGAIKRRADHSLRWPRFTARHELFSHHPRTPCAVKREEVEAREGQMYLSTSAMCGLQCKVYERPCDAVVYLCVYYALICVCAFLPPHNITR